MSKVIFGQVGSRVHFYPQIMGNFDELSIFQFGIRTLGVFDDLGSSLGDFAQTPLQLKQKSELKLTFLERYSIFVPTEKGAKHNSRRKWG